MVWRVATLPMSCYRVSKITTRSVPQSCTGYLSTSQSLVAQCYSVSTEFPFCSSSNLWILRVGTTKVAMNGCERCRYVWMEFEYSRHKRNKGNVLCFGKWQQGFTLACNRLTLEVFVKAYS